MKRILAACVVVPVLLVARCAAADEAREHGPGSAVTKAAGDGAVLALPIGTTITCPEDRSSLDEDARDSCPHEPLVTHEVLFAVPRAVLVRAVAGDIERSAIEADLRACNESLRRAAHPSAPSGLWRAARWAAIGATLAGAFALGVWAG